MKLGFEVFIFSLALLQGQGLILETPLGKIEGLESENFASFLSIPYAQPPTGPLRFQPTQPLEDWVGTLDATKSPPPCPQLTLDETVIGREDCLFLNIFVPNWALKSSNTRLLPVIVFIHGGGFIYGSSDPDFYGPDHFMATNEVILVTLNYRLGPLGWLSTEDDVIGGNMGLQDQIMSLSWIQNYISSFKGNPDQVTILGHSSGAMCVSTLLISPKAEGLFQKAIAMSGPVYNAFSFHISEGRSVYASTLAEAVDCEDTLGSQGILECLQKTPAKDIVSKSNIFERFLWTPNPWKPLFGNFSSDPVLPLHYNDAYVQGTFHKNVSVMLGSCWNEGGIYVSQLLLNPERFEEIHEDFDVLGPVILLHIDEQAIIDEDISTANLLRLHYLEDGKNASFSQENWEAISRMIGETRYIGPIHQQVEKMMTVTSKPLFYYRYRYKGSRSYAELMEYNRSKNPDLPDLGVSHGDELLIMFHQKDFKKSEQDLTMSKKMVDLWVGFSVRDSPDKDWESLSGQSDPEYAVLDENPIRMKLANGFRKDMDFVSSMHDIMHNYRNFELKNHPAFIKLMEDKEKELHDEL